MNSNSAERRQLIEILNEKQSNLFKKEAISKENLANRVTTILQDLGIPTNEKGYHYLHDSIIAIYHVPEFRSSLDNLLYPYISDMYSTSDNNITTKQIKEAIKHVIKLSAKSTSKETMLKYLGYTYSSEAKTVHFINFILTIVNYLHIEDSKCN